MRSGFQSATPYAAVLTVLLAAGPVAAQTPPPEIHPVQVQGHHDRPYTPPPVLLPAPTIASPEWAVAPSVDFPAHASSLGIERARVVLDCKTNIDLSLVDCTIQSETPPGFGFGEAALASVGDARLVPASDPAAIYRFAVAFRRERTPIPPREN